MQQSHIDVQELTKTCVRQQTNLPSTFGARLLTCTLKTLTQHCLFLDVVMHSASESKLTKTALQLSAICVAVKQLR